MGLCGAVDTLASQASGAGLPVGPIFQRAVLFLAVHWCARVPGLRGAWPLGCVCSQAEGGGRTACPPPQRGATFISTAAARCRLPLPPQHPHYRPVCGGSLPAGGGGAAGRHDSRCARLPAGPAAQPLAGCCGQVRWAAGSIHSRGRTLCCGHRCAMEARHPFVHGACPHPGTANTSCTIRVFVAKAFTAPVAPPNAPALPAPPGRSTASWWRSASRSRRWSLALWWRHSTWRPVGCSSTTGALATWARRLRPAGAPSCRWRCWWPGWPQPTRGSRWGSTAGMHGGAADGGAPVVSGAGAAAQRACAARLAAGVGAAQPRRAARLEDVCGAGLRLGRWGMCGGCCGPGATHAAARAAVAMDGARSAEPIAPLHPQRCQHRPRPRPRPQPTAPPLQP